MARRVMGKAELRRLHTKTLNRLVREIYDIQFERSERNRVREVAQTAEQRAEERQLWQADFKKMNSIERLAWALEQRFNETTPTEQPATAPVNMIAVDFPDARLNKEKIKRALRALARTLTDRGFGVWCSDTLSHGPMLVDGKLRYSINVSVGLNVKPKLRVVA